MLFYIVVNTRSKLDEPDEEGGKFIMGAENQAAETDQMRAFILIRVGNREEGDYMKKKKH